jgi:hypothetical protein
MGLKCFFRSSLLLGCLCPRIADSFQQNGIIYWFSQTGNEALLNRLEIESRIGPITCLSGAKDLLHVRALPQPSL